MNRKPILRRRLQLPRIRRLSPPGTAPGTLKVPGEAPKPRIQVIQFSRDSFVEEEIADVEQVKNYLSDGTVTWVNVDGIGDTSTLRFLSQLFGLHGLALEDVVTMHQRAKVEEYDDHLYIVLRMLTSTDDVNSEQLSLFLGKNFVLTFQQHEGDCLNPVRQRLRRDRGRIREAKSDYLAYSLIDAVVDAYFPIVDEYGEQMERMDDELARDESSNFMHTLHHVRGDLMALRRAVRPLRDSLALMMSDPHDLISRDTQFYLRDCYDHTIQLMDLLDTYREMCSDLRDFYMSVINNRMNDIMRVLTIIATIFIPLSFIAGVYGMNFNTNLPGNMPELNWPYGYVISLLAMALVGLGLFAFIWYKGWLGSSDGVVSTAKRQRSG